MNIKVVLCMVVLSLLLCPVVCATEYSYTLPYVETYGASARYMQRSINYNATLYPNLSYFELLCDTDIIYAGSQTYSEAVGLLLPDNTPFGSADFVLTADDKLAYTITSWNQDLIEHETFFQINYVTAARPLSNNAPVTPPKYGNVPSGKPYMEWDIGSPYAVCGDYTFTYESIKTVIIESNADYQFTNHNLVFSDLSTGFDTSAPYPTYLLTFGDGWSESGNRTTDGNTWIHAFDTAGNYTVTLTITQEGTTHSDTCIVQIIDDTTCNYDMSISASKQYGIMPFNYINTTISITGSPALESGSAIGYKTEPQTGTSASDIMYAYFYNSSGTWTYTRNDLGNFTTGTTTYDDALSEQVRFGASGYYKIKAAVMPVDQCTKTDEIDLYVNPTSGVNLYVNFYDGITFNHLNENVHSIAKIVGITDNQSYYGNPLTLDTQIGYNVSIWAEADGYQDKHIYYTVPYPPSGGTVLEIPFYMFPENFGEWYPGNTTWNIFVKNKDTGEPIYGAYCRAVDSVGVAIDSDFTNGQGYLSLQIPYRDGAVRLDVDKIPYVAQSQWVNLGNETTYETTVYLQWSGTPTPTPSYNYTYTITPTQTDTPIPTVTQITNPMLVVWARDAITNIPIGDAYVYIYDGDEIDQTYKGSLIYSSTTDSVQGATNKFQMISNNAYWVVVSKSGYYTLEKRFRMSSQDASIFVPLQPSTGVTVATTQPTLILPTPGGTGIQGGFIGWILDYFSEWFGVDNGTARILLALFIIMCSSVFVGGSLAGFGSGAGAGMGALIGGMFAFIAMCYVQFLPFWLLPIGIAFVGMAFFVWNRQDK